MAACPGGRQHKGLCTYGTTFGQGPLTRASVGSCEVLACTCRLAFGRMAAYADLRWCACIREVADGVQAYRMDMGLHYGVCAAVDTMSEQSVRSAPNAAQGTSTQVAAVARSPVGATKLHRLTVR